MIAQFPIPELRCYMNWLALDELPLLSADRRLQAIRDAGYKGIQFIEPLVPALLDEARSIGLGVCGSGRVNESCDAALLAAEARSHDLECLTLHVGWGLEDDDVAHRLIDAILEARDKFDVPLYVETHRATIFQDMWRTVQFLRAFPELEFNGDFSHWYTGSEMVYGNFERKLEFLQPVIERVRFLHGRIGSPGCMQVDIGNGDGQAHPSIRHFKALWNAVFAAYLRSPHNSFFCFAPELLGPSINYARTFAGREESDRWQQALVLCGIASECFANANARR
jgi:sugar phosphate isomerase/epimerase